MSVPAAPKGAGPAGRKLWRSILGEFTLAEHELSLLRRACFVADVCDQLQATVDAEGLMVRAVNGDLRTHPALVELRQQSILLARLVVALRVPLGDQEEGASTAASGNDGRAQLRSVRGAYQPRGAA